MPAGSPRASRPPGRAARCRWSCLILLGCLLIFGAARATPRWVHGYARDAATGKPLPFPKIDVEGGSQYLGDMEGHFSVLIPRSPCRVVVSVYQYLEAELDIREEDSIRARLYFAHPFTFQTITTGPARMVVRQLRRTRRSIDPDRERNFSYDSYNKIVITTQYVSALKVRLEGLVRLLTGTRLTDFSSGHHIFLMESASRRQFRSPFRQRETVVASRVSGINKPPPLSLVSGFEPLSIFEPFLRIGPSRYISPLAGRPGKRYVFFITDSIRTDSQMIYVVKVNPSSYRNKDLLQGFLYVSSRPFGVMAFHVWPAFEEESSFSLMQSCRVLPSGRWFPSVIKTTYQTSRLGSVKIPITASSKTYIFNRAALPPGDSVRFDEVVFDFQEKGFQAGADIPGELRREPLSGHDLNTYRYYERMGSLRAVDRYLSMGQKLANARFPLGKVDLVFRRAITVNDREGLRLGLGIQTTERLSARHLGGGYAAYGLRDKRWKFGLNYEWRFDPSHTFWVHARRDLTEPGIFPISFNKAQYSTENLRTLRIFRFDAAEEAEAGLDRRWRPNLQSRVSVVAGTREYLYRYSFSPRPEDKKFDLHEIRVALHWSPGEQFARFGTERFSLGSRYPAFWIQAGQGIGAGFSPYSYSYTRWEAKMQWTRKILGLGESGIQVLAGLIQGRVPYPLLFSSRASYRDFSLLSFNSFETMRYNEFLQDRYLAVFFSHKFSRMQISTLPFRPYFILLHNMGWASLREPGLHSGIEFQQMPAGFYESGLFLQDLFVIPLSGINLGIGAGIIGRYGPYALNGTLNNLAFKFSTNLAL